MCDLYVGSDCSRVHLVDVGPWSCKETSPILFTWDELEAADGSFEFRLISSDAECRFSRARTLLGPVELENANEFGLDLAQLANAGELGLGHTEL